MDLRNTFSHFLAGHLSVTSARSLFGDLASTALFDVKVKSYFSTKNVNIRFILDVCAKLASIVQLQDKNRAMVAGFYKIPQAEEDESPFPRQFSQLQLRVLEFNKKSRTSVFVLKDDLKSFVGTLRVQINVRRPVSVPEKPSYASNESNSGTDAMDINLFAILNYKRQHSSLYLPQGIFASVSISSDATTTSVIQQIIRKFKLLCNHQKYCLYIQCYERNSIRISKLKENEYPLMLVLEWGPEDISHIISLEENENGEISVIKLSSFKWQYFEIPELNNFIKIINTEENTYIKN
ncbi:hypothetical protein MXB_1495, partial [Myxobolus squamalis]